MKLNSKFSLGDKVWCIQGSNHVVALTIGQIRIKVTDSPGIPGSIFNNYEPQTDYKESYMCVESGIGSGSVFTFNKNIFATKEEAETAIGAFKKGCTCMKDPKISICPYCMSLLERG